ncbi:hypothetical protein B1R32_10115 [Abditibacterium utsteinense]|uniref:Uncharacterized protein n=1 Tax=Abditibacterium utsteinense TaxID=1960156 RepID=A0A2S8SWV2_9BACT|nr:hypothetical protein B1R32_10115 [Abditibacterium utsteinense]
MITYAAEVIGKMENRPGTWNSLRVGVFRCEAGDKEQIGEYSRNYSAFFRPSTILGAMTKIMLCILLTTPHLGSWNFPHAEI